MLFSQLPRASGFMPIRRLLVHPLFTRNFSTSPRYLDYADTLPNLKIGAHTKVLFQGFTGRQATVNVRESLEWGTKIVGGVKPGVEGEHLGLPVFPSVQAAKERTNPDVSAIYVPGGQTARAIEEALEAEIPLVVAVAEHVPIHDMLRIHSMLRTQSKTRLVGANCPGIISAVGRCRIGFMPLPCFAPGTIGIVNKSGTLSYETVASTTRAGLGQSLVISMGGDVLAGTDFVDALKIFENDPDTQGIILIGEVGGTAELDAAEWIKDYRRRNSNPKPIMGVIGGLEAPHGRVMGHAGACATPGEPDAKFKYKALEDAGVVLVDHPEKLGVGMKQLLSKAPNASRKQNHSVFSGQKRSIHSASRAVVKNFSSHPFIQRRSLYIKQNQALDVFRGYGLEVEERKTSSEDFTLSISVDRKALAPCLTVSRDPEPSWGNNSFLRVPFNYMKPEFDQGSSFLSEIATYLGLPNTSIYNLQECIQKLWKVFTSKEAFLVQTRVSMTENGTIKVHGAHCGFDDAAFRTSNRQGEIHMLRDKSEEVPEEVEAEKDGIIYVKLQGEGSIGTLVNGAGLAMNTVDALTAKGGYCANFLDMGGKATSETVKASFRIVSSDSRVRALFVNIFGGLTRCDMIAEGIMMAFRDLDLKVPVVVRLRGTNEEAGQKMIIESDLPLYAYDSFEDAATKVISLVKGTR